MSTLVDIEDKVDVTRPDTVEVSWSPEIPTRPEWIVEMNAVLSHEVNLIPKIEEVCVKVFQKLAGMLNDTDLTEGRLRLSIKGSSPLRKMVENYIENTDEKTAASLKDLLGSGTLKAADWDSDIVIDPSLDSESTSLLRAYLDHCILVSFQYMKDLMDTVVFSVMEGRLRDIAKKPRNEHGDCIQWISRHGVDVVMKNQDQSTPREGQTTMVVHSDSRFFPILSSPNRRLIGYGAYEDDYGKTSLRVSTIYNLSRFLERRPQEYEFDSKKSIFYVTRNRGIWDGHKGFDIYRSFLSATFPDPEHRNRRKKIRAELIDISIPKGSYYRAEAFHRRQHQMMWNGLPIMNWSAFYEDILTMNKNALDKDGAVLPAFVFKYEKRKRRLDFLRRLMCITGLRMDHLIVEQIGADERAQADHEAALLEEVNCADRPWKKPSDLVKQLCDAGFLRPSLPYQHDLALYLSQREWARLFQRLREQRDRSQEIIEYYLAKCEGRKTSGNVLYGSDEALNRSKKTLKKTMIQGMAPRSHFVRLDEI